MTVAVWLNFVKRISDINNKAAVLRQRLFTFIIAVLIFSTINTSCGFNVYVSINSTDIAIICVMILSADKKVFFLCAKIFC